MATKKSETPLDVAEQITYLHKRILRLEHNSGLKRHPHPTEVSAESLAADAEELKKAQQLREEQEAATKAKHAKDARERQLANEAASDEILTPPGADSE